MRWEGLLVLLGERARVGKGRSYENVGRLRDLMSEE
jgi:hypothetical protein